MEVIHKNTFNTELINTQINDLKKILDKLINGCASEEEPLFGSSSEAQPKFYNLNLI